MKADLINPFVTSGYVSPDYFCDRQKETDHLMKAIGSKRNVTLISLRRMGKTGLLKQIKYLSEHQKKSPVLVYADLLMTMNSNDMLNAIASAVLREKQHDKSIFEKIVSLLAHLRPRLTFDGLTGQPGVELKVDSPAEVQFGLNHLMQFLSDHTHEFVVILDEFQQINLYPEKNVEELLRSIIQTFPGIPFIFSGSSKHMLEPMFNSPSRAFYRSAEMMFLDTVTAGEYREFIHDKFAKAHKKITDEAIDRIFEFTRMHTYYVQFVCNLLFEANEDNMNRDSVNRVFNAILESYEPLYAGYRKLIPPHQYALLIAIARENAVSQPTAGAFIHHHGLNSASSVKTSLKALEDKEMIICENHSWRIYDVFFSRWLEHRGAAFGG